MKLLLSLTLALIGSVAYGQNFKMVDTTPPKEVEPEIKYDSLTNLRPYDYRDYYKRFIGQSILFYPRNPNSKTLPKYFANFMTPHPEKNTQMNIYKPQYVKNEKVTLCALPYTRYKNSTYQIPKKIKDPAFSTNTGNFTPYTEIEGKTFKILDIYNGVSYSDPFTFTLLSENNDIVYWLTEPGKYDGNTNTNQRYPVIVSGYIEKMKQLYLNKDVYIVSYTPAKKYKCTEIVYSGKENQYMVPSLVLKGDNDNLIVPLGTAPSLFSSQIEYYDKRLKEQEPTIEKMAIMEASQYEALLLKQKLASEESAKKEAAEKQQKIQLLCKKYGQTNGKLISEGKVKIGMTKEMCIDAWGKPKSVNKSSGAWGVHEQWVYGLSSYLYFENGKLTSIQN